jgi:hypothetical protein
MQSGDYRSSRSLQLPDTVVTVDRDDQDIAKCRGLLEASDVSDMQQVEATIGEDHGFSRYSRLGHQGPRGFPRDDFCRG